MKDIGQTCAAITVRASRNILWSSLRTILNAKYIAKTLALQSGQKERENNRIAHNVTLGTLYYEEDGGDEICIRDEEDWFACVQQLNGGKVTLFCR